LRISQNRLQPQHRAVWAGEVNWNRHGAGIETAKEGSNEVPAGGKGQNYSLADRYSLLKTRPD
jgi:hypothetical protein